MDKNKSRTDLLAAGRKKLQQFRQKKDSKGGSSHGKSSKKSSKPEQHESDDATSASMSTLQSQVIDGIGTDSDSNLSITDLSGSQSFKISLTPDVNDPSDNSSSVANTYDTDVKIKLASSTEVAQRVQGVDEHDSEISVQIEGESAQDFGSDVAKDVSLRTSDSLGSEGGATNDSMPAHGDILSPPAPVTAIAGMAVRVEGDGEEREDSSLLLSEDLPKTSWTQTREDQVTDEADGLDMKKYGQSLDAKTDNSKKLLLPKDGETAQSFSVVDLEETITEQASHRAEQIGESVEVFASLEGNMSDVLLAPAKGEESDTATGESVMSNLVRDTLPGSSHEEVLLQSSYEQVGKEGVLSGEDVGLQEGPNQQYPRVGSVIVDKSHMLSMGARKVNLDKLLDVSPISDLSSVNLLQLAEVIRGLSEEECYFLLKSRSAVSNADPVASSLISSYHGFPETFQRLKEELFLASCLKDIFNLQVAEQLELVLESDNQRYKLIDELSELRTSHDELCEKNQQLIDELSELRASHNELSEKNQHLVEELADCRNELHDVSSKSLEVQNEFNNAKAEVEALSARVIELQNSFEMSQKDSLDLCTELADCRGLVTALQTENKDMSETLALMTEMKNKLVEEKEFHLCEGKKLSTELASLQNSMEGLKVENSSLSERLSLVTEERNKIEEEIVHLSREIDRLSTELVKSKDLVTSLEVESSNLNGRLALSADQIKSIEEDKHFVILENQKLSSQISALQEQLSMERGDRTRFEVDLKEATMHLEELTKENIFLNSSLEVHKSWIEEIGSKDSQLLSHHGDLKNQAEIATEQREDHVVATTENYQHFSQEGDEGGPVRPPLNLPELEVFDDAIGFVSLNMRLDEVEKIVEKLQKAIDVWHSHSASFGRSGGKVAAAGVSKLIQAFESKGHQDEHEAEENGSSEVPAPADPFVLTKGQIGNLRASLSNWKLDVQNAGALFKWERDGRKNGDAKYIELKDQYEALKQQFSNLEESKVELAVQYEVAMQLLVDIQKKKSHLDVFCEALKQEDICLRSKNSELYDKLGICLSKISELRAEVCDVQQRSNEMASVIGSELENLQKQVTERAMLLERSWNATIAQIFEAVGKLDESVGETLSSTISVVTGDGLEVNHRLAVSVDAAIAVIGDLRKKLEAMYSEHETVCISFKEVNVKCDYLFGKNEVAVGILHKIYSDLMKLVLSHSGSLDEEKLDAQSMALPDVLNYNSYQTIMKNLEDILNEKLELESVFKETKSELMCREKELEELNIKCLGLDVVGKLIRDVESVLNVEDAKIKINEAPLSYLELLVSSLVQRTREADIHLQIARDGYEAKVIKLAEMEKKMQFLDTQSLEHEIETLIFKESLRQAQDSLLSVGSQLHEKTSELKQSELRVASVREKLGIAVAKGKGLVVQRDGLKQSLAETSSELDRCLQELQLKDSRLHEVETKVKTYAEAGERVEALESELLYIRNSANALRESFLLKDSMLQRIEEILEDLDLPEHFHARDIIEKIDWLARSAAGNSLPMNDWDQKSSSELERCLQELQLKDSRLHEVETKLKTYAEAGERVEALESELSYIRNSANALRESFLLKDSMLQRIEEILEDLDLPEHFYSRDIIEKIDWLARSAAGNSLPMNDRHQKSSSGGGSYSDAGFVVMDAGKDDGQMQLDSGDDFRRRFEELQSKYCGLAEQNEMLEQSLMERNSLVQRWEELIARVDMPSHLRSMETEDRIEWLGRALIEANHHIDSLQLKIEKYDSYCGLLNADLEESQRRVSALLADLRAVTSERGHLSERVEVLMSECEKLSVQARQAELENEKLHDQISADLEESQSRVSTLLADLRAVTSERGHLSERVEVLMSKCEKLSVQARQAELENEKLHDQINADLEESQSRVSTLLADLRAVTSERGHLSERVEVLMSECDKLSVQARQAELKNEKLHDQIIGLEEKLKQKAGSEEQILTIEGKIRKLQDLVGDALKEPITENLVSGSESIDSLEVLLRKLIENHATFSSTKPAYGDALDGCHTQKDDATFHEASSTDMLDGEGPAIDSLKKELEDALHELMQVKEERDRNSQRQISLSGEVKAQSKRIQELQELLNQEEQKSASVREKLNVAVRKGKSLVQQRDSLKHTIEDMNNEMERLKSEINNREHTLTEYAQKFAEWSTYPDRLETLKSESLLLKDRLAETERYLQEREYTLKVILNKLGEIEVGGDVNIVDPVMKLEWVGKLCSDLHAAVASLEQESRKSRRASELLLAELNEVQERNDAFQEELAKVAGELVDLRKEKVSAEAAQFEALSHLEKLSVLREEERRNQFSEIMELKSGMNQLYKGFCEVGKLLADALFMDLESLRNIESGLESCMKANTLANVVDSSVTRRHDGCLSMSSDKKSSMFVESWSDLEAMDHNDDNTIIEVCRLVGHQLTEFLIELNSLEESLHKHLSLTQEQDKTLSNLMVGIQRELTSQRESCESMKKEICGKDVELVALRGKIAYLYEACTNSAITIEHAKAELVGNKIPVSFDDGIPPSSGQVQLISEESIKTAADRLLLAAKEFASIKAEFLDANQKELKTTVANLRRELQEKDVQKDRICMELVNQIKDAEATSNSCFQDLQSSRTRERSLENKVEEIEAERKILEHRVNELQDGQSFAAELEGKIRSQTDLLVGKDQEIEALMHALDEEEMQMEEMTKKIEELEKVVLQKNIEIDNLEASRGKLTKKLSITVGKFDELHHLSASLLTEIEKLQSQLQERDSEISFLRQEVTRCTNDVLLASQISNKRSSNEISEFLIWVDKMISREGMHDMHPDVKSDGQVQEYKEILHKKLISLLSAMDDLRAVAESKDKLLQGERSKVDELTCRVEALEMSLHEKESGLNLFEGVKEAGRGVSTSSEILEVEPVINKWTAAGTSVTPQVRSLRKGNNDHVAIAVDVDPGSSSQMDEDDDKVHGFKSLTSSQIVPRFTRPLTDMIDGLWVSCDRALMRQPALRLGIIFYWAFMHALLAFFVV